MPIIYLFSKYFFFYFVRRKLISWNLISWNWYKTMDFLCSRPGFLIQRRVLRNIYFALDRFLKRINETVLKINVWKSCAKIKIKKSTENVNFQDKQKHPVQIFYNQVSYPTKKWNTICITQKFIFRFLGS